MTLNQSRAVPAARCLADAQTRRAATSKKITYTYPQHANTLFDTSYCNLHGVRYPQFRKRHGANDIKFRTSTRPKPTLDGRNSSKLDYLVKDWSRLQVGFIQDKNAELKLVENRYVSRLANLSLSSGVLCVPNGTTETSIDMKRGRTKEADHAIRHERLLHQITDHHGKRPLSCI